MGKWKPKPPSRTERQSSTRNDCPKPAPFVELEGANRKFPPGLIAAWGKESVAKVIELIEDDFHDEMYEVLVNSGLSDEEQTIYLESSSEVHAIRAQLISLEAQVTAHLLPELDKRLKRLLEKSPSSLDPHALTHFVELIEYANSFRQFLTKGTNVRNMRVLELMTGLIMRMLFQVNVRMVDWRVPTETVKALSTFFNGLFEELSRSNGINYAKSNLIDFANKDRRALRKTEGKTPGNFERILSQVDEQEPCDVDLLVVEVDEMISRRRITFSQPTKWGSFVFTPAPAERPINRTLSLVEGALILDESLPFANPIWTDKATMRYGLNEGALEFTVDRSLHELCVPNTHFPLSVLFENENLTRAQAAQLYSKMKALFYSQFRDFLKQLPEDPRPESETKIPAQIRSELNEELNQVMEAPVAEPVHAVLKAEPAVTKRLTTSECRGFRGNEVLSILKGLMGNPVRITGSHHLFRPVGGKLLPIAIHGSASVDPNALRANLEEWGLTQAWRQETGQVIKGK